MKYTISEILVMKRIAIRSKDSRTAFTLIEILVVIGIISVLAALTIGAVARGRSTAQVKTSEQTLSKIASGLAQQWAAARDQATTTNPPNWTTIVSLAGGDTRRARVLWVKMNLQREFPQNIAEALHTFSVGTTPVLLPNSSYVTALSPIQSVAGTLNANTQSAICIYQALQIARRGQQFNNDNIGSSGVGRVNVNGIDFPVFVDAWGNPIGFVRMTSDPSIQAELNEPIYVGKNAHWDAEDREGTLLNTTWSGSALGKTAQAMIAEPFINYNFQPYVFSWGLDQTANTSDDILSFRLREMGQRGSN